jgi:hypothetical protein
MPLLLDCECKKSLSRFRVTQNFLLFSVKAIAKSAFAFTAAVVLLPQISLIAEPGKDNFQRQENAFSNALVFYVFSCSTRRVQVQQEQ